MGMVDGYGRWTVDGQWMGSGWAVDGQQTGSKDAHMMRREEYLTGRSRGSA